MDTANRAAGAMVGMAIGEALGAPFEGLTHAEVIERAGRVDGFIDPHHLQSPQRVDFFTPFTYEDDTQVALACADVMVRGNSFSPRAFRDRLVELGAPIDGNAFGCFRRARRNFRLAVRRMLAGMPWEETGINTAGSGACARGIPIGVHYCNSPDELAKAAIEAALVTHKDPRAVAGTVAIAFTVAACVREGPTQFNSKAHPANLAAFVRNAELLMASDYAKVLRPNFEPILHQVSDALARLSEVIQLDVEPAFAKIIEISQGKGSRPITSATRGFVLTTLLTSLYFFLTGENSYEETVLDVCAEGGSADSLACLVGGLLGSLHGTQRIPPRWRQAVRNLDQVELRGRMLAGAPNDGLKSMVLLEAALTPPIPKPGKRPRPRPADASRPAGGRRPPPRPGFRGGRPGARPPGRPFGARPGGFRPGPRRGDSAFRGPRPNGPRPYGRSPGPPRGPGFRPHGGPNGPRPPMGARGFPPRPPWTDRPANGPQPDMRSDERDS